jgi:hypothetical protein
MLHFGTGTGDPQIWGTRLVETNAQDPEVEFSRSRMDIPARDRFAGNAGGQYLGPLGEYRTDSGWPLREMLAGAYLFDTYATTYYYLDGDYSLAIQTFLSLTDGFNFSSTVGAPNKNINLALTDGLTLHETTPVYKKVAILALTQAMTLHDALALNVKMNIVLVEDLLLSDSVQTNIPLLSYVINANTFAVTKYRNFNFNSFAHLEGIYYGMNDDGIYELDGSDDNGTAIDATITLGKKDFDSKQLKTMPMVYLGVHTTGDLILKVITDSGAERFYKMREQTSGDMKTTRIQLGKGLRSRYWQFELTNVNGADLTLDSIAFLAVGLTRRIGGAS